MSSDQKNALMAVVLSAAILFGWQYFLAPKNQPVPAADVATTTAPSATPTEAKLAPGPIEPAPVATSIEVSKGDIKANITNGLEVKAVQNTQARFPFADVVGSSIPLKIEIASPGQEFKTLQFATKEQDDSHWYGEDAALGLTAHVYFTGPETIGIKLNSAKPFRYRLNFISEAKKLENGQERHFAFYNTGLHHWTVGKEETEDTTVSWAGIDFNYHLFALSFPKPQSLLLKTSADGKFQLYPNYDVNELTMETLFVKKEYNYLSSLGRNLKHSINFGIWGFFAEIILKGLQFFYTLVPNYGVAIIFLTFVVRLITFPLQYKSFVSMKRMQVIQPEITKLKEKFKDDPMRMQKETMELFKRSGANPLGGCLPILLQLPVFFAFYKVLYSAVELVDAPFVGWLHDLSNKDPYFVLPVLMTGAMFLQQKLTPTTVTDPVQKKIFMFMPLIFGFIMKDLPSGLSLYICVSTLLGIAQQLIVFRMTSDKPVVV